MLWNTGFENGVDGQTLASNDPAGGWTTVTGSCVYNSARAKSGGLSMLATSHGSTDRPRILKPYGSSYTNLDIYGRAYFAVDSPPVGGRAIIFEPIDSVNQANLTIGMTTAGTIVVGYSGNEILYTSTTVIAPGQWFRVEWHLNVGGASPVADVRLYARAPDSASPNETFQITGFNLGTESSSVLLGCLARGGVTSAGVYADSVALSDVGWIGPDVTATTRVTATKSASWNIRAPITIQRGTTWNQLQTRTVQSPFAWVLRVNATRLSQYAWTVQRAISFSRQMSWLLNSRPSRTAPAIWNINALIAVNRSITWNLRAATSVMILTSWKLLTATIKNVSFKWPVYVSISNIKGLSWVILQRRINTRSSAWSLNFFANVLNHSSWNISATVGTIESVRWNVRGSIAKTNSQSWNIRRAISVPTSSGWRTLQLSGPISMSMQWKVYRPVVIARMTAWKALTRLTITRNAVWNMATQSGQLHYSIAWNVRGLFANPDIPLMVLDRDTFMRNTDRRPIRNPASNETLGEGR